MKDAGQFDYDQVAADQVEELRALADEIRGSFKMFTPLAARIGGFLIKAKAALPRGVFLDWCRLETGLEPRRAQLYMSLAYLCERHGDDVCQLPLNVAELLAARSVDQAIVIEMLTKARRGERLTVEFVRECIRGAKLEAGEPVSAGAVEMAAMVANALDVSSKMALRRVLGDRPGASDRHFLQNLRERVAADLRAVARNRLPLARRLPAA